MNTTELQDRINSADHQDHDQVFNLAVLCAENNYWNEALELFVRAIALRFELNLENMTPVQALTLWAGRYESWMSTCKTLEQLVQSELQQESGEDPGLEMFYATKAMRDRATQTVLSEAQEPHVQKQLVFSVLVLSMLLVLLYSSNP